MQAALVRALCYASSIQDEWHLLRADIRANGRVQRWRAEPWRERAASCGAERGACYNDVNCRAVVTCHLYGEVLLLNRSCILAGGDR